MINKWWRNSNIAAGLITIIRLYLGVSFLTAGWGKISGGQFDASGFLANAIKNPVLGPDGNAVFAPFTAFLKSFALPNVELFNVMVPWGEFFVGLGLILGCFTTVAAICGMLMNFSFMMAGTVSHSPQDIFIEFLIITAGINAGKYGLDRFVLPYLRKLMKKENGKEIQKGSAA
ncbi:DoxX family protein [Bacillus benzoevorans]|uniref:Thiosulfate dehydrogenase [quinone] large subunit n=1 Tax=Bacillus benzoevorans TaxID=1456 RepID=A0A7X0HR03_9BACI|nr:DoxX family protein [Bacillus benzoevorans]MBB6445309.1 thiosulfate dehydrogenase [quinone] large subunit [Bacillus benzoevorans]